MRQTTLCTKEFSLNIGHTYRGLVIQIAREVTFTFHGQKIQHLLMYTEVHMQCFSHSNITISSVF